MNKCILCESSAVKYCLQQLKKFINYSHSGLHYINKNRYCIARGTPNIAIILKKAWFEKFADKGFINQTTGLSERGIGDTINCENLREFIQNDVKQVYVVYQDGKIYNISIRDFLMQSHRWTNKEGKEVRSISIHYYERINKD